MLATNGRALLAPAEQPRCLGHMDVMREAVDERARRRYRARGEGSATYGCNWVRFVISPIQRRSAVRRRASASPR